MSRANELPPGLRDEVQRIQAIARARGLDFLDIVFEMVDASDVNALAAYGGFPVRYPSWRFGMDYERLEKGHKYGLSKIYELVINNDPAYAYLVRTNSDMEQKLVIAHVCGHADFFKHNVWFQPTERKMLDRMADHATRLREFIDRLGQDTVEIFLDRALALDNLVDPFLPLREYMQNRRGEDERSGAVERARRSLDAVMQGGERRSGTPQRERSRAELPTHDVLGFLIERCELEPWQCEIVRIVRDEAYYFLPQRMTKVMNEGWASLWHSRILTGGVLEPSEVVDFADCHSGATATAPGQLNPYKLGIELWRHAQERGLDLFRLRRIHNDASFLDELADEEFAEKSGFFVYGKNSRTGRTEVLERDWKTVKEKLLQQFSWAGMPRIELVDDDHQGRGELALEHHHDGRDLELAAAGETLKTLAQMWRKPVHLFTQEEGSPRHLTSDGKEVRLSEPAPAGAGKETA
ncbi:MAG: SpoVR family protein [Planctomycetes bacterium]|nr:SpoVR family protein [Planctomycetota bacterium]